jgi:hypothetical protein
MSTCNFASWYQLTQPNVKLHNAMRMLRQQQKQQQKAQRQMWTRKCWQASICLE